MTSVRVDADDEDFYAVEAVMDRSVGAGGPVKVGERVFRPEPEQRFSTLGQAQLFCTLTCIENGWPMVQVRFSRGDRYSFCDYVAGEIALTSRGGNRTTLCHELAHHGIGPGHAHDAVFAEAYARLLSSTGAPQQAALLQALLSANGR